MPLFTNKVIKNKRLCEGTIFFYQNYELKPIQDAKQSQAKFCDFLLRLKKHRMNYAFFVLFVIKRIDFTMPPINSMHEETIKAKNMSGTKASTTQSGVAKNI